eukprot:12690915-Prorocentrum_lima.AAC.1
MLSPELQYDDPARLISVMRSFDALHECEWDHKLIMMRGHQEAVPMDVSKDNMWVVSPPCSGLSELARGVR